MVIRNNKAPMSRSLKRGHLVSEFNNRHVGMNIATVTYHSLATFDDDKFLLRRSSGEYDFSVMLQDFIEFLFFHVT